MSNNIRLTREQAEAVAEAIAIRLDALESKVLTPEGKRRLGDLQAVYDDVQAIAEGRAS